MNTTIALLFSVISLTVYSLDTLSIKRIDSVVSVINQLMGGARVDSLSRDYPEPGLHMKTYLSAVFDGGEMKKFVNFVNTTRVEKGFQGK